MQLSPNKIYRKAKEIYNSSPNNYSHPRKAKKKEKKEAISTIFSENEIK